MKERRCLEEFIGRRGRRKLRESRSRVKMVRTTLEAHGFCHEPTKLITGCLELEQCCSVIIIASRHDSRIMTGYGASLLYFVPRDEPGASLAATVLGPVIVSK